MENFLFLVLLGSGLLVGRWLSILAHELGHLAAAIACGWKPLSIKVGRGRPLLRFVIGDVQVHGTHLPVSGLVMATAQRLEYFRLKGMLFSLSGPAVSVAILVFLWQLGGWLPESAEWAHMCIVLLVTSEALLVIGCLFPHMTHVDEIPIANDGLQAWRYATMRRKEVPRQFGGHVVAEALAYLERGEPERAQSLWAQLPLRHPNLAEFGTKTSWLYALAAMGREEVRSVRESLLRDASAGSPDRVKILDGVACLPLFYDGWSDLLDESLEHVELALQEAPDMITLKGTKSSLLIEMGRLEEGLRLIDEVATTSRSDNDQAIVSHYKALALLKSGDHADARRLLEEAIRKYPECVVRKRIERMFSSEPA